MEKRELKLGQAVAAEPAKDANGIHFTGMGSNANFDKPKAFLRADVNYDDSTDTFAPARSGYRQGAATPTKYDWGTQNTDNGGMA